jgi:hypothetical protein
VQSINVLTTNEKEAAVEGINSGVPLATSGFDRLENGATVQVHQSGQKNNPSSTTTTSTSSSTTGHTAP